MRWDIINYLIDVNGYTDYLEVGVQDYYSCCDKIIAKNKTTVDPAPRNKCDYVMTSDSFFKHLWTHHYALLLGCNEYCHPQ